MCLKSFVGVTATRMERGRNDEVRCRSRFNQRLLRLFGHAEEMDEHRICTRFLMASK